MSEQNWQLLIEELHDLGVLIGCCCIWKSGPGLLTERRLKQQRMHCCKFCMDTKDKYGDSVCIRHDTETLAGILQSGKTSPGLFCCPAGAEEYIIPVLNSTRILGAVFAGPFRGISECRLLPVWRPELGPVLERTVQKNIAPLCRELYLFHPHHTVDDSRIEAVLDYLDTHFSQNITLKTAAERVYLSESRLSHLFREKCGEDFSTYLAKVRVKEAESLLRDTLFSIDEIALRSGLANRSHFSSIFKKYNGLPPGQFRKKAQQENRL
jgi:AraC-like DNA-binding protein